MKLTSTANEVGFDAQRNRLRFFATSYSYSKHFIYAFNGRTVFFELYGCFGMIQLFGDSNIMSSAPFRAQVPPNSYSESFRYSKSPTVQVVFS